MNTTTVIITMAGVGRRFSEAGYKVPKYQIQVRGRTLFAWAMSSLTHLLGKAGNCIFVVRKDDRAQPFIRAECAALGIVEPRVVELDHVTDGQATTVLCAREAVGKPDDAIAVYNIDTYVDAEHLRPEAIRGDGWIPCFRGRGDHWSFVRLGADDRAVEVREKVRVSPYATVGLYWFRSFTLFSAAYHSYYATAGNMERGEKYVAPLYNQLIEAGQDVYIQEIPPECVHVLGTPEEVEAFRR